MFPGYRAEAPLSRNTVAKAMIHAASSGVESSMGDCLQRGLTLLSRSKVLIGPYAAARVRALLLMIGAPLFIARVLAPNADLARDVIAALSCD